MKNILFVTEKWCDCDPSKGWTNHFHNTFKTFSSYGKYRYNTLHLDESLLIYNSHIDNILINYCNIYKIDIIIFSLLIGTNFNPSIECYKILRESGIYLCILWPDTNPDWGFQNIKNLNQYINLHVSLDHPKSTGGYLDSIYNRNNWEKNHISLWSPQDQYMFFLEEEKPIDVSFLGTTKHYIDNKNIKDSLKQKNINIYIGGGQREEKLTPEQYASIIRKSKIGINFGLDPTGQYYQAKGKIFEYTSSGVLLLDYFNLSTQDYFILDKDYKSFSSIEELLNLIDYYLVNKNECKEIAMQGYKTFNSKWTSNHWWETLMNYIEKDGHI